MNLIGDHTDYQDGLCLPMAIDREVRVGFRRRGDGRIRLRSLTLQSAVDLPADGSAEPIDVEPAWGRLAAGVVRILAERGRPAVGVDADITSSVPLGSGLSSSAAVAVALTGALATAAGSSLSGTALALAAQAAEHVGTGMPCGVMDQMASVHGRAGQAVLIDCRSLAVDAIPFPESLGVVVVHSGLPRALAHSAYAQRRTACERAAARIGVATLRDASLEQVADDPIARHVVSENERVRQFAAALRAGDLDGLGRLTIESHHSLARDFAVSTPELDLLVELAVDAGAYGARLTGAGFGGCIVALVDAPRAAAMVAAVGDRYRAQTRLDSIAFRVRAVDGAGPVTGFA